MPTVPTPSHERPLSPHIQVYQPQLTSVLSITHRITGVGLCFGMVVFVAWLATVAHGPETYHELFLTYAQSWIGQSILFGLTFAFFFHLCLGIRHLLWDAGWFLDIRDVYKTGIVAIIAALLLTSISWLNLYGVFL